MRVCALRDVSWVEDVHEEHIPHEHSDYHECYYYILPEIIVIHTSSSSKSSCFKPVLSNIYGVTLSMSP